MAWQTRRYDGCPCGAVRTGSPDEGRIKILLLGGMRASQPLGRELLLRLSNHIMAGYKNNDTTSHSILQQANLIFAPGVDRGFHVVSGELVSL